jgi:hypothetical protein
VQECHRVAVPNFRALLQFIGRCRPDMTRDHNPSWNGTKGRCPAQRPLLSWRLVARTVRQVSMKARG